MAKANVFQTMSIATLICVALAAAWITVTVWLVEMISAGNRHGIIGEQLQVLMTGEPVIYSYASTNYQHHTIRSLDGLDLGSATNPMVPMLTGATLTGNKIDDLPSGEMSWIQRCSPFNDQTSNWYLMFDGRREGHAYFEGFDRVSRRRIGYLGMNGFRETRPPLDEQFAIDGRRYAASGVISPTTYNSGAEPSYVPTTFGNLMPWQIFIVTDGKLVEVNLAERSTRILYESPDLLSVAQLRRATQMPPTSLSPDHPAVSGGIIARTTDRLLFFADPAGPPIVYPLAEELRPMTHTVYLLDDDQLLLHWADLPTGLAATNELVWINVRGEITKRRSVELQGFGSSMSEAWEVAATTIGGPSPLANGLIVLLVKPQMLMMQSDEDYATAVAESLRIFWPGTIVVLLLSAMFAMLCRRRQRRFAASGTVAWMTFVFLFGLFGWIAYRFHRRWPAEDECEACGRRVVHDRDHCIACGEEFAEPAATGIEVFA